MKTCLETIKVENRQLCQLAYHNARMNHARKVLFGCNEVLKLEDFIYLPSDLTAGIYKCRVIYDIVIHKVEFTPYAIQPVHTLQLVEANDLDYSHKYLDRRIFTDLRAGSTADDIIIVKNGFITDISYANIVFWDGKRWVTPATPLLPGTKRQYLLNIKQIEQKTLRPSDLHHFSHARLINALLDLETSPSISIENIF